MLDFTETKSILRNVETILRDTVQNGYNMQDRYSMATVPGFSVISSVIRFDGNPEEAIRWGLSQRREDTVSRPFVLIGFSRSAPALRAASGHVYMQGLPLNVIIVHPARGHQFIKEDAEILDDVQDAITYVFRERFVDYWGAGWQSVEPGEVEAGWIASEKINVNFRRMVFTIYRQIKG